MTQVFRDEYSGDSDVWRSRSLPATSLGSRSREQLAARLIELEPLIRNRVRRKLSATTRRIFDSQDLMSTLLRRIDRLAQEGRLRATSEAELIGLLLRVADNALIDRQRVMAKLRRTDGPDGIWARDMLQRIESGDEQESAEVIASAFAALEDESDRFLLTLWLRGVPHAVSAQTLGISPEATRQRWQRIRGVLADCIGINQE